jgi:hypothetical protein
MKKKNSENYIILEHPDKTEELKNHLINKYKVEDFDIKTIFAGETPAVKILEETEFLPFFSTKKILHVKNSENLLKSDCELLKEYFDKPLQHICLIVSGKSIKQPLNKYIDVAAEKDFTGLFQRIYKMGKRDDGERLVCLFREHLKNNEKDFRTVISAGLMYLRNIVRKQKKVDKQTLNKYKKLQQLDFNLKTGQVHPGSELEIFLFYLFS